MAQAQRPSLSGQVLDITNQKAISGVTITLLGSNTKVETNRKGEFLLRSLLRADSLEFAHPKYQVERVSIQEFIVNPKIFLYPIGFKKGITNCDTGTIISNPTIRIKRKGFFRLYVEISHPDYETKEVLLRDYLRNRRVCLQPKARPIPSVVEGKIFDCDTKQPLIGASIIVDGTTTGTVSDIDGNYSLTIPTGTTTITVSYTGCSSKQIDLVGKSNPINICLTCMPTLKCDSLASFNDLTYNTIYNLGDDFTSDDLHFEVSQFNPTIQSEVRVDNRTNPLSGGSGLDINCRNGAVDLSLPIPAKKITFNAGYYGQNMYVRINGQSRYFGNVNQLHGTAIQGVNITMTGSRKNPGIWTFDGLITSFEVGGDELWLDNFCIENSTIPIPPTQITGTITICGTKEPVIGVNVIIDGTTNGTTTNLDGNYILNIPPGATSITISFTGCPSITIDVVGLSNPVDFCICGPTNRKGRVKVTDCKTSQPIAGAKVINPDAGVSEITGTNGYTSTMSLSTSPQQFTASYSGYSYGIGTLPAGVAEIEICLDKCNSTASFDDLAHKKIYNIGENFTSDNIQFEVSQFYWGNGNLSPTNRVQVDNRTISGGSGLDMNCRNGSLSIGLNNPAKKITFNAAHLGGNMNLVINGQLFNFGQVSQIDGNVIQGVNIEATGSKDIPGIWMFAGLINSFEVGGQELWVDNFCVVDTIIQACDLSTNFEVVNDCSGTVAHYTGPTNIDPATTYRWWYFINGQQVTLSTGIGVPPSQPLNLPTGTYTLYLEQENTICKREYKDVIKVFEPLAVNFASENVLCQTDGSLTVTVAGGSGDYSIVFPNHNTLSQNLTSNPFTIDNLSPDNYPFYIFDNFTECITTTQTANINYVGPRLVNLCSGFGGCNNGISTQFKFRINQNQLPNGPVAYDLFSLDNNTVVAGTTNSGNFNQDIFIPQNSIKAGERYAIQYRYTLPDGTPCSRREGNWQVPSPIIKLASQNDNEERCHVQQFVNLTISPYIDQSGNCVQNPIGDFEVTINGQTYNLQNNQPQALPPVNGASIAYTIAYNPSGADCAATGNINLPYKSNVQVSLSHTDISCHGANDGTATISTIGGNGNRTYQWTRLSPSPTTFVTTNYHISGLSPGDYRVFVLDGTVDCDDTQASFDFIITEPDLLEIPTLNVDNADCGLSATLTDNEQGPYFFQWYRVENNSDGTPNANNITGIYSEGNIPANGGTVYHEVPQNIKILVDNFYIVKVTDANGCASQTAMIFVEQPDQPTRTYNLCIRWTTKDLEPISQPEQKIQRGTQPNIFATAISTSIQNQTEVCITNQLEDIQSDLERYCTNLDSISDALSFSYLGSDYQYTLYYYDRAGNLVRTVAPKGVDSTYENRTITPYKHGFTTEYDYNSLGQVIYQTSPDGGETNFIYNDNGQLRFSQNSKQKDPTENTANQTRFAFTKYDEIGRIVEAGESILQNFPFINLNASQYLGQVDFPITNQSQQTFTFYSDPSAMLFVDGSIQRYLENGISYTERINLNGDTVKVHFSYDPHGNVEWMAQEIVGIDTSWVSYEYDLISGNLQKVVYNPQQHDQFSHRYHYDEDNRLIDAETSADDIVWHRDAQYKYYDHGPLEYTIIGHDTLQKMDYAYTLQGWLKSINNIDRDNLTDVIGSEFGNIPKDAFGLTLQYHAGDFIKNNSIFHSDIVEGFEGANVLYNGNISNYLYKSNYAITTDPLKDLNYIVQPFEYDKLNRLRSSNYNHPQFEFYSSSYTFDANGNMETVSRNGHLSSNLLMDDFSYNYSSNNNQLQFLIDGQTNNSLYDNDVDSGQANGNYIYDKIGNLINDGHEKVSFKWTVDGKISAVTPYDSNTSDTLNFSYDPFGNRILKYLNDTIHNIYLRDYSGNTVLLKSVNELSKKIKEINIYGPNRFGRYLPIKDELSDSIIIRNIGSREYELKDYLGNVKFTIVDSILSFNSLKISNINEYYPFGMLMEGRYSRESYYLYGFNGMELEDKTTSGNDHYVTTFRLYNPKTIRWATVDPKQDLQKWQSPYAAINNNPILLNDPKGDIAPAIWAAVVYALETGGETAIDIALGALLSYLTGVPYGGWDIAFDYFTNLIPGWGEVRTVKKVGDIAGTITKTAAKVHDVPGADKIIKQVTAGLEKIKSGGGKQALENVRGALLEFRLLNNLDNVVAAGANAEKLSKLGKLTTSAATELKTKYGDVTFDLVQQAADGALNLIEAKSGKAFSKAETFAGLSKKRKQLTKKLDFLADFKSKGGKGTVEFFFSEGVSDGVKRDILNYAEKVGLNPTDVIIKIE